MKRLILSACAAASLAALGACASMPTGAAAPIARAAAGQPAPSSADYVRMAAASDLYEIQSSQIVMQTTQNSELRAFAEMMIEHHTMTTQTLTRAAQAAGMTPTAPALDAPKAEMIRQLQAAQGQARDMLYIQQQVGAHEEALTLHTRYANNGDVAQLKTAAGAAVPIVARHYNEITAMQAGMDGGDHRSHS